MVWDYSGLGVFGLGEGGVGGSFIILGRDRLYLWLFLFLLSVCLCFVCVVRFKAG